MRFPAIWIVLLIFLGFLGLALTADYALRPLKIGFVYTRNPDSPEKYQAYRDGLQQAVREINAAGGFAGRPVEIAYFDEEGRTEKSIEIARAINNSRDMIAVIGFSNSRRASRAVGLLKDSGIPILSSAAENFISENSNFFTTNPGVIDEAIHFHALARERNRREALFVYAAGDVYSEKFYKAAADQGGTFTTSVLPVAGGESAEMILTRLKGQLRPQTIAVLSMGVARNAELAAMMRTEGLDQDIYLGRGGMIGNAFFARGGKELKNVYDLSGLMVGMSNEALQNFGAKLHQKGNAGRKGDENLERGKESYLEYSAYAYDMVYLVWKCMPGGKKDSDLSSEAVARDPKRIRQRLLENLATVTYEGVSATYAFDEKHRPAPGTARRYILEAHSGRPLPYPVQFKFGQSDSPEKVDVVLCFFDFLGFKMLHKEANRYELEFMLQLISRTDITFDDLEFENATLNDARDFKPRIHATSFSADKISSPSGEMQQSLYRVRGNFSWPNTIKDFPFDEQEFGLLIRPRKPEEKNFFVYMLNSDRFFAEDGKIFEDSGWIYQTLKTGYRKGTYRNFNIESGEPKLQEYYRSSIAFIAKRNAAQPAYKFILPLTIILFLSYSLFFIPKTSGVEKILTTPTLILAVIALYFSYVMIIDVSYMTFLDYMYIGAIAFIFLTKISLIMQYRGNSSSLLKKFYSGNYSVLIWLQGVTLGAMIGYAIWMIG